MHHPRVESRVRVQMVDGVCSLNLANSASIVLYEARRQLGSPNGVQSHDEKMANEARIEPLRQASFTVLIAGSSNGSVRPPRGGRTFDLLYE